MFGLTVVTHTSDIWVSHIDLPFKSNLCQDTHPGTLFYSFSLEECCNAHGLFSLASIQRTLLLNVNIQTSSVAHKSYVADAWLHV